MDPMIITLILLAFAIVMFVLEKIPLALTSMIVCIALVVTGVLSIEEAFEGFIDTNVILFVAMFIVGGALFETGMANKLGGIVTKLIGIAAKSGYSRSKLLMPLVFAAAMGGNISLIGAPGNLIAQAELQDIGLNFAFFDYGKIGLPMLVAGILFFATIGYKLLPDKPSVKTETTFDEEVDYSNVPAWKQYLALVILVLTILAMIFEDVIGINLAISGGIGAILLILTGVISEKQAIRSIDMQTIFLFGGTLSLAKALEVTGAGEKIAEVVIGMIGDNASPFLLLVVVFVLACVMTNFMSNTATTALLVPISISIAQGMGADPSAVVMATVIGGSCAYATPIGMPANTMVLAPGGYKFTDYVKAGLPLILVSTVVSLILLPVFFPFYP